MRDDSGSAPARGARLALCAVMLAAALAACSPIVTSHGYVPRDSDLSTVQVGIDTRDTVERKLGRPSTVGSFDADEWYYIAVRQETLAFYAAEIVDQRVVTVGFDATGVVADIGQYGIEDGRVIDLVTRTTPTSGRRLTVLQQVFQNLGRFDGNTNILDQIGR